MKKLIITAHPSPYGFTHKIAQKYEEGSKEKGDEVTIIDLYSKEFQQEYVAFKTMKEFPMTTKTKKIQELIAWADELIFINPVWWFSYPAVLKNFFDANFTSGFAFQFVEGSAMPKQLLKGKTARVFMTCDAPGWYYFLIGNPFKKSMVKGTLEFCGIKVKSFKLFDQMRKRKDDVRDKWLQKVFELGKK